MKCEHAETRQREKQSPEKTLRVCLCADAELRLAVRYVRLGYELPSDVCVGWLVIRKVVGPGTRLFRAPPFEGCCGGVLLSHTLPGAVPSALAGLASRFGMETGRFPAAMTTTRWFNQYSLKSPSVWGLCWL